MAVFDTGPGIVGLYENKRDNLNYYIDDKFECYGLYKRDVVNRRIAELEKLFKRKENIYVMDFDAINYFEDDKRAIYGKNSLIKNLKNKKVLCICTKLTKEEKTLDKFSNKNIEYFVAPLLINGANDLVADEILRLICDEYFKDFDFSNIDLIFLASSGLHLKKEFLKKYFKIDIYSSTDAIIEDYVYKRENLIRDYFYVTYSKRGFYKRAERYLRDKEILNKREILNVSKLKKVP